MLIAASLLVLAGCAAAPAKLEVVSASSYRAKASDDLECMVECLEDGSEECEACAERCLGRQRDDVLAVFGR